MKKVIRLTETQLTKVIKRVISENTNKQVIAEQEVQYWETEVDKLGRDIAQKLNNVQISTQQVNHDGTSVPGTYDAYWVRGYETSFNVSRVTSPYLIPSFTLMLKTEYIHPSGKKMSPAIMTIDIKLKNGYPEIVERGSISTTSNSLDAKDINSKVIPLIKGIRITKPKNPCFEGYTFSNMSFSSIDGASGGQGFSKEDNKGNTTTLFKQGSNWNQGNGIIIPDNVEFGGKSQKIKWTCSAGKLTITKI